MTVVERIICGTWGYSPERVLQPKRDNFFDNTRHLAKLVAFPNCILSRNLLNREMVQQKRFYKEISPEVNNALKFPRIKNIQSGIKLNCRLLNKKEH